RSDQHFHAAFNLSLHTGLTIFYGQSFRDRNRRDLEQFTQHSTDLSTIVIDRLSTRQNQIKTLILSVVSNLISNKPSIFGLCVYTDSTIRTYRQGLTNGCVSGSISHCDRSHSACSIGR